MWKGKQPFHFLYPSKVNDELVADIRGELQGYALRELSAFALVN